MLHEPEHRKRPNRDDHPIYGLISQIASSATSFVVLVTLARLQSAVEFGWTALTIASVMAITGVCRSCFGTPVALAAGDPARLAQESKFSATAPTALAIIAATPCALALLILHQPLGAAVALVAPVVLFQDALRQIGIAANRPRLTATSDILRVVLVAVVLGVSTATPVPEWTPVAAWGIGALVMGVIQARILGWLPFSDPLWQYWNETRGARLALLGDSVMVQATPLATSLIVGSALGPVALSAFRGTGTLLGPVSILMTTIPLIALPALSRAKESSFTAVARAAAPTAGLVSGMCLLFAVAALLLPDAIGTEILGASWEPTSTVLPIVALQYATQPWTILATITFKLGRQLSALLLLRMTNAIATLAAVAVSAHTSNIQGVVVAMLVVELVMACAHLAVASRPSVRA